MAGLPKEEGSIVSAELIEALGADIVRTFEALQFPIGLIDLERRVRWQNAASIELLGDVRGRLDASHVAPESLGPAREQFARKLLGAAQTEHEVTVVCADGTHARIETSSVPINGPNGIIGVLAVGRVAHRALPPDSGPDLTPRQRQTLTLLAAGCSTGQMAERMAISNETVRNHVRSLCRRLGATSRIEAVAIGRRAGLL